jgi:hypothetical protein
VNVSAASGTSQPELEQLFWSLMGTFERQAIAQYDQIFADPAIEVKRQCLALLEAWVPPGSNLARGDLQSTAVALANGTAAVTDPVDVLVIQGLVLERVRSSVYRAVAASSEVSERARELARNSAAASAAISAQCTSRFEAQVPAAERFARFVTASDDLLHRLDAFGEQVDSTFGAQFSLRFADVVGDFTADLLPVCSGLGMERRKVLGHLANAMMGL